MLSSSQIKLPSKPNMIKADDGYTFDFDRVYRNDSPEASRLLFEQMAVPAVERFCQVGRCQGGGGRAGWVAVQGPCWLCR